MEDFGFALRLARITGTSPQKFPDQAGGRRRRRRKVSVSRHHGNGVEAAIAFADWL